ncbi:MAG: hypothetical protein GXX00_06435, partial [Hungateiclostridium thermocellum]|nr:hypothetical protein [Acetivibrio thermocellus]
MEKKRVSGKINFRKLATGALILILFVTVLHGCNKNQVQTPADSIRNDVQTGELTDTASDNTSDNKLDYNVIKDYALP